VGGIVVLVVDSIVVSERDFLRLHKMNATARMVRTTITTPMTAPTTTGVFTVVGGICDGLETVDDVVKDGVDGGVDEGGSEVVAKFGLTRINEKLS
jgi:hypothetical protein